MNCEEVRQILSKYYDAELSDELQVQARRHLAGCDACAQELASFRKLSKLALETPDPGPPVGLFERILEQLSPRTTRLRPAKKPSRNRLLLYVVGTAVCVLIAVGIRGSLAPPPAVLSNRGLDEFTARFEQYLDRFQQDPAAAQQYLAAQFGSTTIEPEQAVHRVGYRPAVARGLPAGYSIDSTYAMEMSCCTCLHSVCRRPDGSSFAIFEHGDCHPGVLAGRPETKAVCGGKKCGLVKLDGALAVRWAQGDRQLMLVGLQDRDEIDKMIHWLAGR